jgi:general secretion pathway protein L
VPKPVAVPVWLLPPPGAVLTRTVQVPRAAATHFDALLRAEADRWTSFPIDEIVCGWGLPRPVDDNRVEIELRFVARSTASSWAEALERHGLVPTWLVLGPDERFRVRWRTAAPLCRRLLRGRNLLIGVTAAAALLAIGADWGAARREQGLWQERIGAQRTHLARQRELETRIGSLLAAVGAADSTRTQPRAPQLAALAAALPASDWVTELSFKDDALMLRGYAKNVELLLKALEPLARDGVVTVQGELALDARLERQRFTVSLRSREGR